MLPFSADRKALVGAVHLLPLPGSPKWVDAGRPGQEAIVERALADAAVYLGAGFDGLIVENYGDAPFFKTVPAETVAAVARCARELVVLAEERPVGVNILRNDPLAALACAVASGARFVRINVHSGAAATDQGVIEGNAAETLRRRAALGANRAGPHPVAILADVHVKHAQPLGEPDLAQAAKDTAQRGLADGLIVSGVATGSAPDADRLEAVRQALPTTPLWLGSGLTADLCPRLVPLLDGAIVGSATQRGGVAGNPVDRDRAAAVAEAFRAVD